MYTFESIASSFWAIPFWTKSLFFRDEKNVKAMDAAEKLNSVVIEKSSESKLVFINLPAPPHVKSPQKFYNCKYYYSYEAVR